MYPATPKVVRQLILWTCAVTLGVALFDSLLGRSRGSVDLLERLLAFSWDGIRHGFMWQFFTYLFVHPSGGLGISYSLLIELFVNMYLLWLIGSSLVPRIGSRAFLAFYLLCGAGSALSALGLMALSGTHTLLAGSSLSLLASLCLWALFFPEAQLVLFYLVPVKATSLIAIVVGASLLIDLSHWALIHLFASVVAVTLGLIAGVAFWNLSIPFDRLQWLEQWVTRAKKSGPTGSRAQWSHKPSEGSPSTTKIFDLKSGRPVDSDDETFVDRMLDKISREGEKSLTPAEKKRLEQIASHRRPRPTP